MLPAIFSNRNYVRDTEIYQLISDYQDSKNFAIGCKDLKLTIRFVTRYTSQVCCGLNPEKLYGLNDYEIPGPAAILAGEYVKQDQKVLVGKKLVVIDLLPFSPEHVFLTTRVPLVNQDFSIMGSAFLSTHMTDKETARLLAHLIMSNPNQTGSSLILQEQDIIFKEPHKELSSKREFEVLWLLSHGMSIKKIAKFLDRSIRTVEDHIDQLKIKYECTYKNELIERAISDGILAYLPESFIHKAKDLFTS